jgi:2-haloacid dehalogenase
VQAEQYRTYAEVLSLTLERLAEEVGYGIPEGESGVLPHSLPDWPPFPEAPAALAELRERGWHLGILSNIDRALIVESEKQLGVPFDLIVTADDVGAYKPEHAHFERFFELASADKERHVHVGASLFHDVAPANELGLHSVWISRGGADAEAHGADATPDRELPDLSGLPDVLDDLVRS